MSQKVNTVQLAAVTTIAIVIVGFSSASCGAGSVDSQNQIKPLLHQRCYSCHGPKVQKSGLRLDNQSAALAGGDSGAVIVPGKSGTSELIRRVRSTDPDDYMPPRGPRLTAAEVAVLERWIDTGARWPESVAESTANHDNDHWAWKPVGAVPVPPVPTFRPMYEPPRSCRSKRSSS